MQVQRSSDLSQISLAGARLFQIYNIFANIFELFGPASFHIISLAFANRTGKHATWLLNALQGA